MPETTPNPGEFVTGNTLVANGKVAFRSIILEPPVIISLDPGGEAMDLRNYLDMVVGLMVLAFLGAIAFALSAKIKLSERFEKAEIRIADLELKVHGLQKGASGPIKPS